MSTPLSFLLQGHSSHLFIQWNFLPNDLPTGNPPQAILGSVHRTGLCILPSNMSILVTYLALCNSTALLPVCPPPVTIWRHLVGCSTGLTPCSHTQIPQQNKDFASLFKFPRVLYYLAETMTTHLSLLNSGAPQHPWLPLWWLRGQLGRPEESLLSLCYSMKITEF